RARMSILCLRVSFAFMFMLPRPSLPTLFPYTTLFRSPDNLRLSRQIKAGGRKGCVHGRIPLRLLLSDAVGVILRDPVTTQRLGRSEEHTSELQSRFDLVCRLLLEKKKHYVSQYVLSYE